MAFGLLLAAGIIELLLHLAPGLLPGWYLERFPPNGIEFFRPGVLDKTPLAAVPLPYGVRPWNGPPPHDLVDAGAAAPADGAIDAATTPKLVLPADADGLPNIAVPEQPDIALVGDSFAVFASQRQPEGLQAALEQRLSAKVLNVGISGIGPDHELWLLQHVALPKQPRLVVWMFYAGNDLVDSMLMRVFEAQGHTTWGQLFAQQRRPFFILPSLVGALFGSPDDPGRPNTPPLPGLPLLQFPQQRQWFYPDTLRLLTLSAPVLADHPAWLGVAKALRSARAATEAAGARFLVVYLPSREQIYLPRMQQDADWLHRCASKGRLVAIPLPEPTELLRTVLANRTAIEATVTAFCRAEGMNLWSATEALEALADAGELGYYLTDTHWNARGQLAVAERLIARIRADDLLRR